MFRSSASSNKNRLALGLVNAVSGRVGWTFRTLDPDTGQLPEDPLAGFLPPNDATGRGEGHIAFTIQLRAGDPIGTILTNQASIVFDTNTVANTVRVPHKIYLPLIIR